MLRPNAPTLRASDVSGRGSLGTFGTHRTPPFAYLTLPNASASVAFVTDFTIVRLRRTGGTARQMPLEILFREVPEGYEFVAVLLTILGSLGIMVLLGAWWSR